MPQKSWSVCVISFGLGAKKFLSASRFVALKIENSPSVAVHAK